MSGNWVDEMDQMSDVVTSYFTKLFTSSNPRRIDEVSELVSPKINVNAHQWLSSPYSEEELVQALTTYFYQNFWNEVKQDIVPYCLNILNHRGSV